MKLLNQGDRRVQLIIGKKKVKPGACYRWSCYAVLHSLKGEQYLYHNFTKRMYVLEGEPLTVDAAVRYSAEEIADSPLLLQLAEDSFLVPEDLDETAVYESYCTIARGMKVKKNGYSALTILPTTACNARCVYCFEQGMKYVTMQRETVDQLIAFIKKEHNPDRPIRLSWFGGEPLIGRKIIERVCNALREADIPFYGKMISNGSLVTEPILRQMKEEWNLERIQITLDGTEDYYNTRKNYYFNYQSAYWHVLSRIKMINEGGIRLVIRVNVDDENIDTVLDMADDLKNFIVNPDLVSFDLAPLFDLQTSNNGLEVWEKVFSINDALEARGYRVATHYSVMSARTNFCMADNPYVSLVVAPDGKLYNCEHIEEGKYLGDLWNGVTEQEQVQKLHSVEPAREQCRGCFSLPNCTTFTGCPYVRVDCRFAARKRMERTLNRAIPKLLEQQAESLADEDDDE